MNSPPRNTRKARFPAGEPAASGKPGRPPDRDEYQVRCTEVSGRVRILDASAPLAATLLESATVVELYCRTYRIECPPDVLARELAEARRRPGSYLYAPSQDPAQPPEIAAAEAAVGAALQRAFSRFDSPAALNEAVLRAFPQIALDDTTRQLLQKLCGFYDPASHARTPRAALLRGKAQMFLDPEKFFALQLGSRWHRRGLSPKKLRARAQEIYAPVIEYMNQTHNLFVSLRLSSDQAAVLTSCVLPFAPRVPDNQPGAESGPLAPSRSTEDLATFSTTAVCVTETAASSEVHCTEELETFCVPPVVTTEAAASTSLSFLEWMNLMPDLAPPSLAPPSLAPPGLAPPGLAPLLPLPPGLTAQAPGSEYFPQRPGPPLCEASQDREQRH